MPTYDYHCPPNGRVVEVSHKLAETIATWGELCKRAGLPLAGTSSRARVERLITGGPCGAPACGRGSCAFN
jgi:hypothetical protein